MIFNFSIYLHLSFEIISNKIKIKFALVIKDKYVNSRYYLVSIIIIFSNALLLTGFNTIIRC
jgi:hypothetical protein